MTCSPDTDLESVLQRAAFLRPSALGRQAASYGGLGIRVTVEREIIAKVSSFAVTLHAMPQAPDDTVDADFELGLFRDRLEYVLLLQNKDIFRDRANALARDLAMRRREMATPTEKLASTEDLIQKLTAERNSLKKAIHSQEREVANIELEIEGVVMDQVRVNSGLLASRKQLDDRLPQSLDAERGLDSGFTQIMRLLHKQNMFRMDEGHTPLQWASANRRDSLVSLLLAGGDVEARVDDMPHGITPLIWAARFGLSETVALLLQRGALIEAKDGRSGGTALAWAVGEGETAVVQLLLDKGADIESESLSTGYTPLMWAAEGGGGGHVDTMRLLLEKGANINARSTNLGSALHVAVGSSRLDSVSILLDEGANIEAIDGLGRTPLFLSVAAADVRMTEHLIKRSAKVTGRSKSGETLLHTAARTGNEELVRLLLSQGLDGSRGDIDAKGNLAADLVPENEDVLWEMLFPGGWREDRPSDVLQAPPTPETF